MDVVHASSEDDCGQDFCGRKSYDVKVDYGFFPNGFVCTTPCDQPRTNGSQAFQYWHDGLYLRLIFSDPLYSAPQYNDQDMRDAFESGYLFYEVQDGARWGKLGLSFAKDTGIDASHNAVVEHVGFENGQLVLRVRGSTTAAHEGGACDWDPDCDCYYEGEPIDLSFEIRSTIERPPPF